MKLIIDIDEDVYKKTVFYREFRDLNDCVTTIKALENGTPIPDNATNGDVIKTIFDNDKVSEFMGYVRIMARVGNWFNDGIVAEFDKDWWKESYQKGGKG